MPWWDAATGVVVDAAGNVWDAAGNLIAQAGNQIGDPNQPFKDFSGYFSGEPSGYQPPPGATEDRLSINQFAPIAAQGSIYGVSGQVTGPSQTSSAGGSGGTIATIMGFGYPEADAQLLYYSALQGNTNNQKLLASMGIEPFATAYASAGGGAGGAGGRVLFPEEQAQLNAETARILAQTGVYSGQARQIGALFDPNYADGALITLPDGTQRINGTEIILDTRARGQFKPVTNAPGYLVDPVTGTVIDTNGNIIRRAELDETIRSNQAREGLTQAGINADVENNRNRLSLDTTLGVGDINLRAATSENEQALANTLGTNRLNLDAFDITGNLNIGATNAETNRLNSLTQRTQAGGNLALGQQELQDARVQNVINLASNPQNFVQREYETRAIQAPAGITSPAYRENPNLNAAINTLVNTVPDVGGLLPTYQQPSFKPAVLPNASLPRVTAPTYTQLNTTAPIVPVTKRDAAGVAYTPSPTTNQAATEHFQNAGVPQRFLTPLGYAYGTEDEGTREDEFIVGDPQSDGLPNPELVQVNNPGPDTNVSVTPMDMDGAPVLEGEVLPPDMNQSGSGLEKLLAGIIIEIGNQWGATGGPAQYAYGTRPSKKSAPTFPEDWGAQLGEMIREMLGGRGEVQQELNTRRFYRNMEDPLTNWPKSGTGEPIPNWNPADWPENTPGPSLPNYPWTEEQMRKFRGTDRAGLKDKIQKLLPMFAYGTEGGWGTFGSRLNNRTGNNNNSMLQNQPVSNQQVNSTSSNLDTYSHPALNPIASAPLAPTAANPDSMSSPNSGVFGPRDSAGNFLGLLTSNTDEAIQNMPNVRYAQDYARGLDFNQLGVGNIQGAFGTILPDVGALNLRQLNDIAIDPDAWGTLASLYSSGNRNLQSIYNRVLANAPRGNAVTSRSVIRT